MIDQTKLAAALAISAVLVGIGAAGAWTVQGWRLDALQARYDGFVSVTKANGEAAQREADRISKADKSRKEQADAENNRTLAGLRADVKRLRNARAGSSYLPAAAPGTDRPERIAFDRAELESAIRSLDQEVSGIVGQGDEARVNLDTAKRWAQDKATGMKIATALQ